MSNSWELIKKRLRTALDSHGGVAEFVRKTRIARSNVDGWLKDQSIPKMNKLDLIALGLNQKAWQLIQPEEDKSLVEKLIPFDMVETFSRLSPDKQKEVLTNWRSTLSLANSQNEPINKKKASG